MKQTLIILRGLPASGKTTLAKSLVEVLNFKRVNKDSIRRMIDNGKYSEKDEKLINQAELAIADIYLSEGYNLVIDDTNLRDKRVEMLKNSLLFQYPKNQIKVIEHIVNTNLNECIARDKLRGKLRVGDNVIINSFKTLSKQNI